MSILKNLLRLIITVSNLRRITNRTACLAALMRVLFSAAAAAAAAATATAV
jgi:hypothetical protein